MFRKRASSNPPRRSGKPEPITNPATLAALQGATRAVAASNNGLSSAAAAAALKTHPSTRTSPGDLQTKRMVRRGSNASMASAPGNLVPRQVLQRQNSNGSMSERSFRAQSPDPNRHNSLSLSNGLNRHAPPVPPIPKNLQESASRRSTSTERPPMRVASPPPQRNGRGVSVDRALGSSTYHSPADRTMSLTGPEREEQRRSINFSRPMSPPLTSRDSPTSRQGHSGWFTEPATASPSARISLQSTSPSSTALDNENTQQSVRNASGKPVAKKQYASATEGIHLAKGGMQTKPTGTAVQARQPASPTTRSSSTKQPLKTVANQTSAHLDGVVQRTASVSPARSARFLDTGVEVEGVKHQPPPRSLSPAKSALKSSATSPGRTASPAQRFSSAVSEASDVGSDDGRGSATKKKKNVRVSFDEGTVDHSAESPPTSPTRGLQASRWSGQTAVEDEFDEIMKPRPALPSFGSLRGRPTRDDDGVAEKVTETVTSSMTNSVSTLSDQHEASKDQNLGNIVAQDFVKKGAISEPLAPRVTSVGGQEYHSDSDMESVDADAVARPPTPPHTGTTKIAASPAEDVTSPIAIAVQPPTPKVEQEQSDMFVVPGGWEDFEGGSSARSSAEQQRMTVEPAEQKVVSSDPSLPKPKAVKSVEEEEESEPPPRGYTQYDSPSRTNDTDVGLSILEEESESDRASIYSDAEEELSDGGGFASLDAIVENPIISTPPEHLPKLSVDTSPSPLAGNTAKVPGRAGVVSRQTAQAHVRSPSEDWDEAKQYWNGLSLEKRKELEREEAFAKAQAAITTPDSAQPKSKKKKKPAQQTSPVAPNQSSGRAEAPALSQTAQPRQTRQAVELAQPILRQSMRQQDASPPLQPKSSLRQSALAPRATPAPMRQTMRGEPPKKSPSVLRPGLSASKYSSGSDDERELRPRSLGISIPPLPTVPPLTQRGRSTRGRPSEPLAQVKDDSDSDSSFRRERRPKPRGGMTMRSSMRGAPQLSAAAAPPSSRRPASMINQSRPSSMMGTLRPTSPDNGPRSSRWSVRSSSPTGSFITRFRSGSIGAEKERPSSKSSMSLFGGKKEKKTRPSSSSSAAPVRAPASRKHLKSNIPDSSDDETYDEPLRRGTKPRRPVSPDSDEDGYIPPVPPVPRMPEGLTPVRGIPRGKREDDADSTDLEGENSDKEKPKASAAPSKTTQGSALLSGSLRDSKHARIDPDVPGPSGLAKEKKKRGFFGLGRKKTTRDSPIAGVNIARPSTPTGRENTASPVAASPVSPTAAMRGKLQRRNTPQRMMSDSWPLPEPPKITGDLLRPASSDGPLANGLGASRRPPLGERITSTGTTATAPMVRSDVTGHKVIVGRSGKKKRFQGLRRAFGIDD